MVGTSYGGYAVLVALTATPDKFACGVAVSAPSNLATLIESFPPYWELELRTWHRYVGDPNNAKDRLVIDAKSPIFRTDAIQRPLLLAHGENDARVKLHQTEDIANTLRKDGKLVELLVFKDEGHFITAARSNLVLYLKIEQFLYDCLGGLRGDSRP